MRVEAGLVLALLLEMLLSTAHGIKWLALASSAIDLPLHTEDSCNNITGLVKRQRRVCKRNIEVMEAVKRGAAIAVDECRFQFRNRRWNCSMVMEQAVYGTTTTSSNSLPQQGKKNKGTREAAFVHAISSAGVAHAVTRSCSAGHLESCGCDRSIHGRSPDGFQWAGCSDNVAYGNAFSKNFVDVRERAKGKRAGKALMNLHNNEAGRKILEYNMKVQCKCHGVSGSCELKTCWRAMPTFREVGQHLREKFDGATEVEPKRIGTRRQLVPRNTLFKHHTEADLVYIDPSPDFCEYDPRLGSLGTKGRLCSKNSRAIDGCELMCCGRGYMTKHRTVMERCHCKFHWCCTVKCQKCERNIEEHFCR